MTSKTPKSATICGIVVVLSFSITSGILNILVPSLIKDHSLINYQNLPLQSILIYILIVSLLLLIFIALASYWIYKFFGKSYFDEYMNFRWGTFGILTALFIQIPIWLFHDHLPIIRFGFQILGIFLAFGISRMFFPIKKPTT